VGDYKNSPYEVREGQVGVDIAIDHEELAVHAVSFVHRKGPVFYASLPCKPSSAETHKGCRSDRAGVKHLLVSTLWDHLSEFESPYWKRCQSSGKAACTLKVVCGLFGRPHLLLGEYPGPAISFSESGGKIWAALCGDGSEIGLDVAETDEFLGKYPFHRVFHPQELQDALRLVGGDVENASALLWSVKEAVVKALGCAFHLVDPLQLIVCPSPEGASERAAAGNEWHTFSVRLSGKALVRFSNSAGQSILVHSLPQRRMWLSIALLNWQYRYGDE